MPIVDVAQPCNPPPSFYIFTRCKLFFKFWGGLGGLFPFFKDLFFLKFGGPQGVLGVFSHFFQNFFFKFWGPKEGFGVFFCFFKNFLFSKLYWPTVISVYFQFFLLSISFSTDYCLNIF